VLVVERGEPGREASYAAAGMLAATGGDVPPVLQDLAVESARLYPEFVRELEAESHVGPHEPHLPPIDYRQHATLVMAAGEGGAVDASELTSLEPGLQTPRQVRFLDEASVDPRSLLTALALANRRLGTEIAHGAAVTGVARDGSALAVRTK